MTISIRDFHENDAHALRDVFYSSVHQLTDREYDEAQRFAWASAEFDPQQWKLRMGAMRPFVACIEGSIAGYADVQINGYIDHFFVSPRFTKRGVGNALMQRIHMQAAIFDLRDLFSDVSDTAQPFFARNGFVVASENRFEIRGVSMTNATMRKAL